MEKSTIYDLLDSELLNKWREQIDETEKDSWFFTAVHETFEELEKQLSPQEKQLLQSYSIALVNKLDYVFYNLKIKVLNFGIKMGMELERAFLEFEA